MAYSTINKSTDYFNTKLYTGNGGTNAITGVGHQPDWTWIKKRSGVENHFAFDSVRGATKYLFPNAKNAEGTDANTLSAFGTDGFTVGSNDGVNENSATFASWNWKAGTAVSGNTTGSGSYKTYTGSVSTTAGFSIIKYTGNGSAGHTIPHHLGAVPKLIIVRQLGGDDWKVYSSHLTNAQSIKLDENGSYDNDAIAWNSTTPTSSVFTLGTASATNKVNEAYISYCFADVTGYSKFGSYIGNGELAIGPFIYTGFKPAFVILKEVTNSNNWRMFDSKRDSPNDVTRILFPSLDSVEGTGDIQVDTLSNGFKIRTTSSAANRNSSTYIYMCFGQSLVGSNNTPCTAR